MTITEKVKKILPYVIAVVCSIAFFSFSFFPEKTDEYIKVKAKHQEAKKRRTIALNKLKSISTETEEYQNYIVEKKITDEAWKELNRVKKEDRVFNFSNIQQFFGQFGVFFGLLIYSIFNLFRTFTSSNNDKGYQILHTTLIGVSVFYLFWIFQPLPDLSLSSYYFASVITTLLVSYSVYLMSKYSFTDIGKMQGIIRDLFDFILIDTKEKGLIKEEKKSDYKKMSIKLVKNALDNE